MPQIRNRAQQWQNNNLKSFFDATCDSRESETSSKQKLIVTN